MSEDSQKLRLARVEPGPEAAWPKWIADALTYKPESETPIASPKAPVRAGEGLAGRRVLRRVPRA